MGRDMMKGRQTSFGRMVLVNSRVCDSSASTNDTEINQFPPPDVTNSGYFKLKNQRLESATCKK